MTCYLLVLNALYELSLVSLVLYNKDFLLNQILVRLLKLFIGSSVLFLVKFSFSKNFVNYV